MKKDLLRKTLVFWLIFLFIGSGVLPIINGSGIEVNRISNDSECQTYYPIIEENMLDMQFIYNITENLSNIIFTEYNESAGEIAKGRAFGSVGERKAAEILEENFSKLGLWTIKEQIQNIQNPSIPSSIDEIMYPLHKLTHIYEVLDYELILTNKSSNSNETVNCQITPLLVNSTDHPELIHNFSYKGLKLRKRPQSLSEWISAYAFDKEGYDYVFIYEKGSTGASSRNPNVSLTPDEKLMRRFFYPIRSILTKYAKFKTELKNKTLYRQLHNYQGSINYDSNGNAHNTGVNVKGSWLHKININETIGEKIIADIDNYIVDFYVKQRYNKSVISYNVIGQLNGTDPSKTVIVCSLYDSVWCQGTADSAIGMAIVLGIAKYFTDNNIIPKYNMKFIGFCGEEAGNRGPRYYEATHRDEDIIYVIDMNQVGFSQNYPKLTLNLIFNKIGFMNKIWEVAKRTNYEQRVNDTAYIAKRWWPEGVLSNQYVFNHRSKTVCFLKDFPWVLHHRDGLNHTAGDVLDYFDWNDTATTGEIALNVTLHLTVKSENQILRKTVDNDISTKDYLANKFLKRRIKQ
ncbi:MAG: M28 family peptidase [Thermoplasmatales archaeon]|nr:M28 family peptidase [Thermoplasmatales archaeon]